jgi:hypothetical protein
MPASRAPRTFGRVQTDVNGNRVRDNRPDLQYDLNGTHHNVEFDTDSSSGHAETIRRNDPSSICTVHAVGGC